MYILSYPPTFRLGIPPPPYESLYLTSLNRTKRCHFFIIYSKAPRQFLLRLVLGGGGGKSTVCRAWHFLKNERRIMMRNNIATNKACTTTWYACWRNARRVRAASQPARNHPHDRFAYGYLPPVAKTLCVVTCWRPRHVARITCCWKGGEDQPGRYSCVEYV
jgi:hypothetical protein